MSDANVIPLNFSAECIRGNVEWFEAFTRRIANNEITAMTLVGIDKENQCFAFKILPIEGKSLRYMQIGQLHEAICQLDESLDESHE